MKPFELDIYKISLPMEILHSYEPHDPEFLIFNTN